MILIKLGWAAQERGWRVVSFVLLAVVVLLLPQSRLLSRRYWQRMVAEGRPQCGARVPRGGFVRTNLLRWRAGQLLNTGHYAKAASIFLEAMWLVPEDPVVRGSLRTQYAWACLRLGNPEEALRQIAQARREFLEGWGPGWRTARRSAVFCRTSLVLAKVQRAMGYEETALLNAEDALVLATKGCAPVAIRDARMMVLQFI